MDSTTDRKVWEKKQKQERIIAIAEGLFFDTGHEQTTLDAIAAAAGYNRRTLYWYFSGKEDILLAVVLKGQNRFLQSLKQALEERKKNVPRIRAIALAVFDFSLKDPDYFHLIMGYESRTHDYCRKEPLPPENSWRQKCQKASDRYEALTVDAILADMNDGIISSPLSPRQLMLVFWGQVYGIMHIILIRREGFEEVYGLTPETLFQRFLDMSFISRYPART